MVQPLMPVLQISIHALREEGDVFGLSGIRLTYDFYPRPPRGGRLLHGLPQGRAQKISIHALREEGDVTNLSTSTR